MNELIETFVVLFIYEAYLLAMSNGQVNRIKERWEANVAWDRAIAWGWR